MKTPASLLERLRSRADEEAWARFVDLYTPVLYCWARRIGLQQADAADLVQDVLALLVNKLPDFQYDERRSFRGWLWTLTLNKYRENRRRAPPVAVGKAADLADVPAPDDAEAVWESEYQQQLVSRALEVMKTDFQPTTWIACWEYVVRGRPASEVAAELGITVGAVHSARFRVLARLRQELRGMLE
jgi:RNA polymerase sigma-70 factor (ECF subfamily)